MSVSKVSKRLSNLGEGPFWDDINQKLYHVDAFVGDICCLDPITQETETVNFCGTVTVAIPFVQNNNHFLVTCNKDIFSLEFDSKNTVLLGTVDKENPKSRFNDGKCDSKGRFWGGTLLEQQEGCGKLWMLKPNSLEFQPFAENVVLSNGLDWSSNDKNFYYVDSGKKVIYSFDFDSEAPKAENQRVIVDFEKSEDYCSLGVPDGMTVDMEGKLWVACFGGSCVVRIDPENGKLLQKVKIPAKETTSCCFGGPNFDILYVTTSYRSLNEAERNLEPDSGAVFAVTNLGVKGNPAHRFDLKV